MKCQHCQRLNECNGNDIDDQAYCMYCGAQLYRDVKLASMTQAKEWELEYIRYGISTRTRNALLRASVSPAVARKLTRSQLLRYGIRNFGPDAADEVIAKLSQPKEE